MRMRLAQNNTSMPISHFLAQTRDFLRELKHQPQYIYPNECAQSVLIHELINYPLLALPLEISIRPSPSILTYLNLHILKHCSTMSARASQRRPSQPAGGRTWPDNHVFNPRQLRCLLRSHGRCATPSQSAAPQHQL